MFNIEQGNGTPRRYAALASLFPVEYATRLHDAPPSMTDSAGGNDEPSTFGVCVFGGESVET